MDIFRLVGSVFVDTDEANKSLQKTDKSAETTSSKLGNIASTAGKVALGVGTAAAGIATAIGVKAVNAASEFETSFAQVTTLLDDTTDLDAYKQSIIDLSNKLGKSTGEISEAVYGAISAGTAAEDAVSFVGEAMKLAEGGFTDAATAVDIVTTAINAYGMEAKDASRISDILVTTQNLGKTTVDELASSMGKVIPTANTFGVSIENLAGMYVTMTANGIATAESTTYMNSMLNELGKSGTKASDALKGATEHIKEGGMSFKEMMDEGWELTDVLSLLDETAAETGVSMMDMFGSAEAGKAAAVLWQNAEKLNDATEAMGESAGTTEEAFNKMHNTTQVQMETLKTNFENAMIMIGSAFMPVINDLLSWVLKHMPEIQAVINTVVDFIKAAIPYISQLIQSLKPIVTVLFNEIKTLWDTVLKPVLDAIIKLLNGDFKGAFSSVFTAITNLAKMCFNGLIQIVKAPLNTIIGIVNKFIGGLNLLKIPDWIPEIGGKGVNIPSIPYLAKGGSINASGYAVVGEDGAELVNMPRGATVTPLNSNNNAFAKMESELSQIHEDIQTLAKAIMSYNPVIQMDTGVVVGQLANPINDALGMIAIKENRAIV